MPSSEPITLTFAEEPAAGGLIAVPVTEGLEGESFLALDERLGKALTRAAKAADFGGKAGQSLQVPGPDGLADAVVLLLGVGDAGRFGPADAAKLGGRAVTAAGRHRSLSIDLGATTLGSLAPEALAAEVALGARLRAYYFTAYRKKAEPDDLPKLRSVTVATQEHGAAKEAFAAGEAVAEGVVLARDLVSEPPNVLYPDSFAERCRELQSYGVEVEILGVEEMQKLGMNTLLGVGQGSTHESRLAVMRWKGEGADERPIALIGKGVTFDSGGLSLKPGAGMEEMKMDMGGAAAVTGAMRALAGRKAKAHVVGLLGLVENMPDGKAQRPSDVVTSMSGQTVEILNTDAEGRLVMADVLTYAQERFKPTCMLDLATLTGAIIVSLADQYAGVFSEHDDLAAELLQAGEATGDRLWRMPLDDAHRDMIKSDIADMKNIGGRDGGSSTAAAFLSRFVGKETPWAHLDIAGMAWAKKDKDVCPKGATGYGVRLIDAFVKAKTE